MLKIVSGVPGTGKTLNTLGTIQKYIDAQHADALKDNPEAERRQVYQSGIPELTLDWHELTEPESWYSLPAGSIIVIDEAQRIFPVMSPAAKRPDHYTKFDMHRHQGHDIWLITQDPALIDSQVRAMCGEHTHLVRPFNMDYCNVYRWPSVQTVRGKDFSKDTTAITSKWPYDKKLFGIYKSAEQHTHKRSLPKAKLIGLVICLLLPPLFIWYGFSLLNSDETEPTRKITGTSNESTAFGAITSPAVSSRPAGGLYADLDQWVPQVEGEPRSAPIYSTLLAVRDFPTVTGCMSLQIGDVFECSCTDQQGSGVNVTLNHCKHFISTGIFDPTKRPEKQATTLRSLDN